jgi:hypothetical protein
MALIKTGIIIGSLDICSTYLFLNNSNAKSFDFLTRSITISLVRSSGALPAGYSIFIPKLKSSI